MTSGVWLKPELFRTAYLYLFEFARSRSSWQVNATETLISSYMVCYFVFVFCPSVSTDTRAATMATADPVLSGKCLPWHQATTARGGSAEHVDFLAMADRGRGSRGGARRTSWI